MAIMATKGSSKDFAPAPEGVHQAVCVDVVDLGEVQSVWLGVAKMKHMVRIAWQIAEARDDGKPFLVTRRYTLSLHEKSALRKDLESWRGKKFTPAEESGFDVEVLLNKSCLLNITHRHDEGTTYANVAAIMPLVKGMPSMQARDYVRVKDRTDKTPTPEEVSEDVIPF